MFICSKLPDSNIKEYTYPKAHYTNLTAHKIDSKNNKFPSNQWIFIGIIPLLLLLTKN